MSRSAARELRTASHPALAPTTDLAHARALLASWRAPSPEQDAVRGEILAFVDAHPDDAHRRSCVAGHLTASALLVDARGERVLLTLHRALGRWLQLGGHCDGDANLVAVALREAEEESGIGGLAIDPEPLDLDVHAIPARPAKGERAAEPAHLHLDTRFVVWAPQGAREVVSHESLALRWFGPDELQRAPVDDSVRRLLAAAHERSRGGRPPSPR